MQNKPDACPFLRISKHYNVDYGEVLCIADAARRGVCVKPDNPKYLPYLFDCVVFRANQEMKDMQSGVLDWQTEERING